MIDALSNVLLLMMVLFTVIVMVMVYAVCHRISQSRPWRRAAAEAAQRRHYENTLRRDREADRRDFARSYEVDINEVRDPSWPSRMADRIASDLRAVGTRTLR